MNASFKQHINSELASIREAGLYKQELPISSPQGARIAIADDNGHRDMFNLCANNYLGLANAPELVEAACEGMKQYGYGLASVRFICGTQNIHKELETQISEFLGMEDTILYASCFDANGGLFETLFNEQDAIISDALNHASIIDGVRLCKAARYRYSNNDMTDLEAQLQAAHDHRFRLIATDGVFSMDGVIANLSAICDLADKYDAMVMVDDSHAVGVLGKHGRGSHEYRDVMGRIDIITGTLGKALGGGSGGYTASSTAVTGLLRQRSRPYLFSNSIAPAIVYSTIQALPLIENGIQLRDNLHENSRYFRDSMEKLGFRLAGADHPIIPVMIGDATQAKQLADQMVQEGIFVIAFSYPVVPKGEARIRVQMSAAHTREQVDKAIAAFAKAGLALGVIE